MKRQVVVTLGDAQLVRQPDGSLKLLGGTKADRVATREWVARFLQRILIR